MRCRLRPNEIVQAVAGKWRGCESSHAHNAPNVVQVGSLEDHDILPGTFGRGPRVGPLPKNKTPQLFISRMTYLVSGRDLAAYVADTLMICTCLLTALSMTILTWAWISERYICNILAMSTVFPVVYYSPIHRG